MSARRGQINVSHAFTANLGLGDFNATLFADDAAVLQALVLSTQALIVLDGSKDLGAKQTVPLWLECAVVDGFWFLHLTERPRADLFGRCHANFDGIKMLIRGKLLEQVE